MAAINSSGSIGFGTNILNPADKARVRSSTLTYAVRATAGICLLDSLFGLAEPTSRRMAEVYTCMPFGAAGFTTLRFVDGREEVAGLAAKHPAHFFQGLEIDSERLSFFKTPERGVADSRFLSQPVEGSPLRLQ
jgi:hypothetical protein